MAATNRRFASARMKVRNPMRHAANRAKMSRTLRAMHWKPKSQGGNGRPTPVQQAALAEALGWPVEVIVPTGQRGGDYPTHYKIDIGDVALKIGVEVDGNSHCSRRALDAKKDAYLTARGWHILRFTNKQVDEDLPGCLAAIHGASARAGCS